MKKHLKTYEVMGIGILGCVAFYFISQGADFNYLVSSLMKVGLFVAIPMIYQYCKQGSLETFVPGKQNKSINLKTGLIMGGGILAGVLISYLICIPYIDASSITTEIATTSGVPKMVYPIAGVYATFGNSFVEEYFFRGFIFMNLLKKGKKKLAYIFSAGLFAIYHVAIIETWFNLGIMGLVLVGLFLGGLIFNRIDEENGNILNSWLVHIFADVSVMIIATKLFYF